MNRKLMSSLALVLLVVLFVSINIGSNNALRSLRFDLTEEKRYTLADGSRRIIENIDEQITLRLYFSASVVNDLPAFRPYAQRVRELLEEYVSLSDGKIRLELVDPKPFTEAEDNAVRQGIQGVPINETDKLYFGLIGTNMTDDQESISFFQQEKEAFLEYELTKLIYNLTDPKRAVVGLLTGYEMNANVTPMMRLNPRAPKPWAIVEEIRQSFELKALDPNFSEVDKKVDVLLIVHPAPLSDQTRYAIDQFVLAGGKTIVYLDPMSEMGASQARAARGRPARTPVESNLPALMKAWGVEMSDKHVVGDWDIAREVNIGQYGRVEIVRYLPWLKLAGGNYNTDDVVTSQLGNMMFAGAGAIAKRKDATTKVTPLIQSSTNSMLMDVENVKYGPDPKALIKNFKADGIRHVIAARISGPANSAFPDGRPKQKKAATKGAEKSDAKKAVADTTEKEQAKPEAPAHLAKSKSGIQVVVVSDSDNLFDNFWVRVQELMGERVLVPTAANANFLINAIDNLSGSSDLIGLRSRQRSERPFIVVEKLRRQAEQKFLARETELNIKLEATQKKITELESKAKSDGGALLSEQQVVAINEARQEIINTRRQLREVQANLNHDIEVLERQVKVINIAAVPLLFTLLAIVLALLRHRRRRHAHEIARA